MNGYYIIIRLKLGEDNEINRPVDRQRIEIGDKIVDHDAAAAGDRLESARRPGLQNVDCAHNTEKYDH